MNMNAQITQLMMELGPYLSLNGVYEHDDNTWSIFFDEHREIFVNFHKKSAQLVFSCDLILPKMSNYLALYECLLSFNVLWHKTGFARFGLMMPKRKVEFSIAFSIDDTSLVELASFSRYFDDVASYWHTKFQNSNCWQDTEKIVDDDLSSFDFFSLKI